MTDVYNYDDEYLAIVHERYLTGSLTLERSEVMEFIQAYDYFEMLELRDRVLQHVKPNTSHLNPENVLSWRSMAKSFHLDDVLHRCQEIISVCFKQVAKGEVKALAYNLLHLEEHSERCILHQHLVPYVTQKVLAHKVCHSIHLI